MGLMCTVLTVRMVRRDLLVMAVVCSSMLAGIFDLSDRKVRCVIQSKRRRIRSGDSTEY